MVEQRRKLRLGELMVQQGLISQDQLRIALMEQEQSNIPLGRQLVRLGFITESVVRDLVAHTIGQESIDLATVIADADALNMVQEALPAVIICCQSLSTAATSSSPWPCPTCSMWWR